MSEVTLSVAQGIATITMNRPRSLNAITADDYDKLANTLREVDKREDVIATIWQATGKWFCAGTDVKSTGSKLVETTVRHALVNQVSKSHLDCGHAFASHSKILIAVLNGPVMGPAFLGYFDFIYALPNAWLSTPFSFLGIIPEAGSSVTFVNKMGWAKANEALIWGRKMTADELLESRFINKIFPQQSTEEFHATVRQYTLENLEGLDPVAILGAKRLVRAALDETNHFNTVLLREGYAQAERFASGRPRKQFERIAKKEIKHKL
ncbi:hypothetical protein EYR40_000769 [Pleurotus pulmonarius]|nr:hypothetical protein EYR40_000769 [Pleurotus pulmonarius]